MRKVNSVLITLIFLFISACDLFALNEVELVSDYNAYRRSINGLEAIIYNDKLYFGYDDGENGEELYVIDSPDSEPQLVKDINAGSSSSRPAHFALAFGQILFSAETEDEGNELWITDGTEAGTQLFNDINPTGSSNPQSFIPYAGGVSVAFSAFVNGSTKLCVAKAAGVTCTTIAVGSRRIEGAPFQTKVIFAGQNNSTVGQELWSVDSDAMVNLIQDIRPAASQSSSPRGFATVPGKGVIFSANDGTDGSEPWFSDGTTANQIADIAPGGNASAPLSFTFLGGEIFFNASNGNDGFELWKTDLSDVEMVKDISPGPASSFPRDLTVFNNKIYFSARDMEGNEELWVSDGTSGGTMLVKDINPDTESYPYFYTVAKNKLFFIGYTPEDGEDLYVSDGTTNGTMLFENTGLRPGAGSSYAEFIGTMNNQLVFWGFGKTSDAIFFTDETGMALKSTLTFANSRPEDSDPDSVIPLSDDSIFLRATSTDEDDEPRLFNPITEAITTIKDVRPGAYGSSPFALGKIGNLIILIMRNEEFGQELWVTDGTEAGTKLLKDIMPGEDGSSARRVIDDFQNAELNGYVFFRANDGVAGDELWKTDGTAAGTKLVKDINPAPNNASNVRDATFHNGKLYFAADDGTNGEELWVSDGTEAGTMMVRNINLTSSSGPRNLYSHDGLLFFQAFTGFAEGVELWKSDGTEAGTTLVKDLYPGSSNSSRPQEFTTFGNDLFFAARGETGLHGLYKLSAPYQADDIELIKVPDADSTDRGIRELNVFKNKIFFSAPLDSPTSNELYELWSSDGTTAGTQLLKDIYFDDTAGSNPNGFFEAGDYIYFQADDGINGKELWKTDGTTAGTQLAADIFAGEESSRPFPRVTHRGVAYFSAEDDQFGRELFKIVFDECPDDAAKVEPGQCGCGSPDVDTDGDGTLDCSDSCEADALKTTAGICGCGVAETDSDGDGTPDCADACNSDALKAAAGSCGCGVPDTDLDGSGVADCLIPAEVKVRSDLLSTLLTEFKKKPKKGRKARVRAIFQAYKELNRYSRTQLAAFVDSTAKKTKKRLKNLRRNVKKFRSRSTNKNKRKALKALARFLAIAP